MTLWWKLSIFSAIVCAYTLGVWRVHDWYDASNEVKAAINQTKNVEQGTNNIIKFNQEVTHANDPKNVGDIKLPPDVIRLLK